MYVLAIHDGHNASAALISEGKVIFAAQEERYVNEKNIGGFPFNAVADLMDRYALHPNDIEVVALAGSTEFRSESLTSSRQIINKYHAFLTRDQLPRKRILSRLIEKVFRILYRRSSGPIQYDRRAPLLELGFDAGVIHLFDHHECHAAGAAHGWGRNDSFLVVTMDSSGDGLSGTVSRYEEGALRRLATIPKEDSVARIYSLVTYYMGMVPMEHEYKIMGMAPYSEAASQSREIAEYFKSLFELATGEVVYRRAPHVEPVQEMGPRIREYLQFKRFDHIAAGLQLFVEEFVTAWIANVMRQTNESRIALSGGLFMNVKLNKKLLELSEIQEMYVLPSCGDESNVFGAGYLATIQTQEKRPVEITDYYLGPEYTSQEIKSAIGAYTFNESGVQISRCNDIEATVADLLSENNVVARMAGRMEFGARSLGNRAILANPADPDAVNRINKMIKSRDFWMPFAPSMIDCERYVHKPKNVQAPYMILTFDTREEKRGVLKGVMQPYDETTRPQEVFESWNPSYYRLIREFEKRTGESAILNTSFNLHGSPLVRTPEDALFVFDNSGLEYLAIGDWLLSKASAGV